MCCFYLQLCLSILTTFVNSVGQCWFKTLQMVSGMVDSAPLSLLVCLVLLCKKSPHLAASLRK